MAKKDIKIIVGLWVLALILSALTTWAYMISYNPATATHGPASISEPTTHWLFQPASSVAERVRTESAWMVFIIMPFLYGPFLMLFYIISRFSKSRHPVADKPNENLTLEVAWTIVPALALIVMAVPAYEALRYMEIPPARPDQVINVTGAQFYWQYELPRYGLTTTDNGTITIDAKTGRATEEDSWLHLPINKTVLMNGQSFQVNHAWWVPAFGVKFDVIPGRINTVWFDTKKKGYFKGQCAELCGTLHAYMRIQVVVEEEKDFYEWVLRKGGTIPEEEEARVVELLGADYRERFAPKDGAKPASLPAATESAKSPVPATAGATEATGSK
ncbi:cytochrome c oxidase subunit II [Candidatus Sumerlaeota bacterium]|nr:cytochrome c oxidase subunit II [Candidatus Sumerlaeota bacterium]